MAKQTFTTGQVLTAAQMTSLQQTAMGGGSATAKTTSYVLEAADAGTTVAMNAAGATTITVNTGLFAAGDTVTIQNLGAGTCTVTAGTATVSTAGSLALVQYESGILYFTATGAAIFNDYVQAGSSAKVLQVVSVTKTDTFTSTSTTYVDVTGLTLSITPTLNTSKILVLYNVSGSQQVAINIAHSRLMRDSTAINIGAAASSRDASTSDPFSADSLIVGTTIAGTFLDSPATTSATTYKFQVRTVGNTVYINRTQDDTDSAIRARTVSTITLMEIGA